MNCSKPYILHGMPYGCGQCIPCRINRRRIWTHRILLEAAQNHDNTFITLTYDDEHMPRNQSVSPRDVQLFVKRHRKNGYKFRYFACGEYGEATMRPHYHLALFGHENCRRAITRVSKNKMECCDVCSSVAKSWGQGQIMCGQLEPKSAAYIAGYVTKKMTKHDDYRLEGRLPEFARMSLRPAIGVGMMHELASTLMEHKLDEKMVDVPLTLQHGMKQFPLGRFLRRKLRTFIGKDPNTPKEVLDALKEKVSPMREAAFNNSEPLQIQVLKESLGRRIRIEANEQRYRKKDTR